MKANIKKLENESDKILKRLKIIQVAMSNCMDEMDEFEKEAIKLNDRVQEICDEAENFEHEIKEKTVMRKPPPPPKARLIREGENPIPPQSNRNF